MDRIVIRPMEGLEELQACVRLQEEVWGEAFSEKVPVAILMVGWRLGGVTTGAFDAAGELVGFVFGLTGWEDGDPVHWSDMLAVRSHVRGQGLGLELKKEQRRELLERGVRKVQWTFDPMESRNAYLNFGKLGGVAREYRPNLYGTTGSVLHGELPTDRLVVTWELDSERVVDRLTGKREPPGRAGVEKLPRALDAAFDGDLPVPEAPPSTPGESEVVVTIPARFGPIRAERPEIALEWLDAVRESIVPLLERGYEVRELVPAGTISHYLLIR